jgi:predicted transcriptional regulator
MKSAPITLRLPLDLIRQLDELAENTQRTRSALGCEAIRRHLDLEAGTGDFPAGAKLVTLARSQPG